MTCVMSVMKWFLLRGCFFGVILSLSEADVTLTIVDGTTSVPEGSDVQLLCTISPYLNIMTWYVDNDPYGGCFVGSCSPTVNKPYTFLYTFNEAIGEFRLTIDKVNSSHADLVFACDDGNERKAITFNVTSETVNGGGGFNNLWYLLFLLLIPAGIAIGCFCCFCCKDKQDASNTKRDFQMTTSLQTETPKITSVRPFTTHCYIEWTGSASKYLIEYRLENEKNWKKQGIILKEETCLQRLHPGKLYKIRVYAISKSNAVHEPPGESHFKTKGTEDTANDRSKEDDETISTLPIIKVTKISANNEPSSICYEIKWDVENLDELDSDEFKYMLEYSLAEEDNWTKEKSILFDKEFKFEGLLPDTSYKIRVYAFYQSKVLLPGEYQFRTQPMRKHSLPPIKSKRF